MEPNPYLSPAHPSGQRSHNSGERVLCAWIALTLAAILPALFLWEYMGLPRLPMGNVYFNIIFTFAVFILTMLSVPLGVMGIRSRSGGVAALAVLLGTVETVIIFYVKFYPVLYYPG